MCVHVRLRVRMSPRVAVLLVSNDEAPNTHTHPPTLTHTPHFPEAACIPLRQPRSPWRLPSLFGLAPAAYQ